jgi:hypothetical protein
MHAMREEWENENMELCRGAMSGWASRVKKILEDKGYQFEHLKNLRKDVFD